MGLFSKEVIILKRRPNAETDQVCVYCEESSPLNNDDLVLCEKFGVVRASYRCRKFSYDPLKRRPAERRAPKLDYVDIDSDL